MLSRKAGKLASAAALGIALATTTVGTTPAYADQGMGRLVNDYVYTYPTDTICIGTRNYLNAQYYPNATEEYYYCGGSGYNVLWLRHYR